MDRHSVHPGSNLTKVRDDALNQEFLVRESLKLDQVDRILQQILEVVIRGKVKEGFLKLQLLQVVYNLANLVNP